MPADSLTLIALVFVVAGWVKGVVGLGLPTVAMGALGLVMAPAQAAALLVLPSLVTNVWQLLAGPSLLGVLRRLAVVMVFICLGTALGIGFMTQGASRWPSLLLGIVLAAYGVIGLFALGAGLGALLSGAFSVRGIWASCGLLAVSFLVMFVHTELEKG